MIKVLLLTEMWFPKESNHYKRATKNPLETENTQQFLCWSPSD